MFKVRVGVFIMEMFLYVLLWCFLHFVIGSVCRATDGLF